MQNNYIITIGRQLGSGGKSIGELLSKELNIPCYDKELILMASSKSGLNTDLFEKIDEINRFTILSDFFDLSTGMFKKGVNNETLYQIQSDVIQDIAKKESCIFVGRTADYILRNHQRLVSIFINADYESRMERVKNNLNISEKEAKAKIEQIDKKRAGYYNYYTNKTWGMACSYDLCINSSVLGIEKTTSFIIDFIKERFF